MGLRRFQADMKISDGAVRLEWTRAARFAQFAPPDPHQLPEKSD